MTDIATAQDSEYKKPKHCKEFPFPQQVVFWRMFQKAQQRAWAFRAINHSPKTQYVWAILVIMHIVWLTCYYVWCVDLPILWKFELAIEVVVAFQLYFVLHHMLAHALFLNYDRFDPNAYGDNVCIDEQLPDPWRLLPIDFTVGDYSVWSRSTLVYYVAFMHHHEFTARADIQTITSAHWYSFTLIVEPMYIPIVGVCITQHPPSAILFAMWELCVLLLPIAHGYQHPLRKDIGILYPAVDLLVRWGILSGREEHRRHHNHEHECVYQGFESSGLNIAPVGPVFDAVWNLFFRSAVRKKVPVSDVMGVIVTGGLTVHGIWLLHRAITLSHLMSTFFILLRRSVEIPSLGPLIYYVIGGPLWM